MPHKSRLCVWSMEIAVSFLQQQINELLDNNAKPATNVLFEMFDLPYIYI